MFSNKLALIIPSMYMLPVAPIPPVTFSVPVPELVLAVPCVKVVAAFDVKVVNAPAALVLPPIAVLSRDPVTAGLIVTVALVPVGLIVTAAFAGLNVTVLLAPNVVNAPVALVVAPIDMLLIVPAVPGDIVTVPVPVGLTVTVALAGFKLTVELTSNVVPDIGPPEPNTTT
jgi:hypothetical protein